ncbi:MAG: hypothetical protein ACK4JF_04705 [Methylohalobius sp.]
MQLKSIAAVAAAFALLGASAHAVETQGGPTSTPTHTVPAKPGKAIEEITI